MKLVAYQFSEDEIPILKIYRDTQPDARLQRRILALLMVAEGAKIEFVQSVLGISEKTLQRWFDHYHQKGIDALNSFQYKPSQARLSPQEQSELKAWVKKKDLETVK